MSAELDPELQELEERLRAAHAGFTPRPGLRSEIRGRLRRSWPLPWQGVAAAAAVIVAVGGMGYLLSRQSAQGGAGAGTSASTRDSLGSFAVPAFGLLPRPGPVAAGSSAGLSQAAPGLSKSAAPLALTPPPATAPVYRWATPAGATIDYTFGAPTFSVSRQPGAGCATPVSNGPGLEQTAAADLHQAGVNWTWPYTVVTSGSAVRFVRLFDGSAEFLDRGGEPSGIAVQVGGCDYFRATGLLDLPLASAAYRLAAAPSGSSLVYVAVPDGSSGYFEPAFLLPDGSVVTALAPDELRP